MSNRSARLLKILIALLIIAAPLIYWQRWAIPGMSFLCTFFSGACLVIAFFLVLFLPWQKRGLRTASRVLRWVCVVFFICFAISVVVVLSSIRGTAVAARQQNPTGQCLLVLGAGLYGETPSANLQNRLQTALTYMQANPDAVAVLTGGQGRGETITEASAMQTWLVANGIAEQRLYLEERATSTGENIAFSEPIVAALGYSSVVIVTNNFHLLRASLLSTHYGLSAELLGAPLPTFALIPLASYTREYFALVKDWLLLNIYPQGLPASE